MLFLSSRSVLRCILAIGGILFAQALFAQQSLIELNEAIIGASDRFLSGLDADQRERASFEFDDEERLNWHFIPRARAGVTFKEMTASQLSSARELLQTLFSAKGFEKTENVRDLENVLAILEPNGPFVRDPDIYYITVFGSPSLQGAWGIRYEGHHLAFNWTFIEGVGIASTPQFFGSNPAEVRSGEKQGQRVLAAEEDMGRELLKSLNERQKELAIIPGEAPRDIFTGAQKQVTALNDSGISFNQLSAIQQEMLLDIVVEVASAQTEIVAQARIKRIMDEDIDAVKFAWIGGAESGDAHYYRIQGESFLIEYDNTQNDANHVHLVWRDFDGDFGRDLIRLHYDAVASQHDSGHQH